MDPIPRISESHSAQQWPQCSKAHELPVIADELYHSSHCSFISKEISRNQKYLQFQVKFIKQLRKQHWNIQKTQSISWTLSRSSDLTLRSEIIFLFRNLIVLNNKKFTNETKTFHSGEYKSLLLFHWENRGLDGFCHNSYSKPDFFFLPSLASEQTLVLFALCWAQWHFLLSKGLLLVSLSPSTIPNLMSSPYRKLKASKESNQNLLSWSLCCLCTPMPWSWVVLQLSLWLWAGSYCSSREAGSLCPVFMVQEWMDSYNLAQGGIMQQSTLQ